MIISNWRNNFKIRPSQVRLSNEIGLLELDSLGQDCIRALRSFVRCSEGIFVLSIKPKQILRITACFYVSKSQEAYIRVMTVDMKHKVISRYLSHA